MPPLVDAAIALFVLAVAWNGFRGGFLLELAGLARIALAVVAGLRFFSLPAGRLVGALGLPAALANLGGFLAVFAAVEIALTLLFAVSVYPAVEALHRLPAIGGVDRLLGIVPAALQALFWAAFALTALLLLPINPALQTLITRSTLGNALVVDLSSAEPRVQGLLGNAARAGLLSISPAATPTEGTVRLHFPPDLHLSTDDAAERTMLAYLNAQRGQRGLPPLRLDPTLVAVARAHSADMFRRSYFSHDSPDGASPFDRMHAAGIRYSIAGENIAYAPNVTIADTGLMNSPEHRDNILRPQFTRVGIGIVSGGLFEEMFTQDFAD